MTHEHEIGLLETIQYMMVLTTVAAAVAWDWYLIFPLAASIIALPYAVWRKLQSIERGNGLTPHHQQAISKQGSVSPAQVSGRSATIERAKNGEKWNFSPGAVPAVASLDRETTSQESL